MISIESFMYLFGLILSVIGLILVILDFITEFIKPGFFYFAEIFIIGLLLSIVGLFSLAISINLYGMIHIS
jgi:hypothetical protein